MIELDCRGLRCPLPVIELAKCFPGLGVGDEVAVASNDAAARVDIQAWCRMRGHEYVGEGVADDGTPRFVVRKIRA